MSEDARCPVCRRELSAESPDGPCPACLNGERVDTEIVTMVDVREPGLDAGPIAPPFSTIGNERQNDDGPARLGAPSEDSLVRKLARRVARREYGAAEFAALIVVAAGVVGWQVLRATAAERVALAERMRALDAEQAGKEMADRALQAEQTARDLQAEDAARARRSRVETSRIIDATVYLKTKIAGKVVSSGTGVVVDVQGDTVVVATNQRVALPDVSDIPSCLMLPGGKLQIEAVFWSGQGPQDELAASADTILADTSDNQRSGPAFLVLNGVKRPPTPIDLDNPSAAAEGSVYLGTGFPLGGVLNNVEQNSINPSVAVTRGLIARLRPDAHGQVMALELTGLLPRGMSGGPIIEERTGAFIGVSVFENARGKISQFVIPANEVRQALAGRVGRLDLTLRSMRQGIADVDIRAQIVDPRGVLQDVMVLVAESQPTGSRSAGHTPLETELVRLAYDRNVALAAGSIQIALPEFGARHRILVQIALRNRSGRLEYSQPKEYDLPARPGRIHRSNAPVELIVKGSSRESFSRLERLVDPDEDCRLVKEDERCTIEISGKRLAWSWNPDRASSSGEKSD